MDKSSANLSVPTSGDPSSGHHTVESFHLVGGKHFKDVKVDFVDGLNILIGSPGSGKSTILQNIRHSVGAPATGPRAAHSEALVKGTLANGRVSTTVRTRHGIRYVGQRTADDAPQVTTPSGEHQAVSLHGELFRVEVYTQKEIESMAESRSAQLALLDKFAEPEIRDRNERIAQVERRLTVSAAALGRLNQEMEDLAARVRDLPSVTAALSSMAGLAGAMTSGSGPAGDGRIARGRERAVLTTVRDDLRTLRGQVDAFEAEARRRLALELGASPNRAMFGEVQAGMERAREAALAATASVRGALADVEARLSRVGDSLAAVHATQSATEEADARRLDVDRERTAERDRLQRRFLELEAVDKALAERRREHDVLEGERRALRTDRTRLIRERFEIRARVASNVNEALEGKVEVSILANADWQPTYDLLIDLLKGARLRSDYVKVVARALRADDILVLLANDDTARLQELDDSKTGRTERAHHFLNALRASGRVLELDTVARDDIPLIQLKIEKRLEPSDQVSGGQACSAILPILLLQSASPLLIDEPEHCLDNSFIYNVLVPALLHIKKGRQLIFATHNPNFPVLADAERVIVMEETKGEARVLEYGTVDEVRGSIERLLEGGREAFRRRGERYGHIVKE